MEEGVDGVRIMTVHKAKGLEFPVVILVDLTAKDSREPTKWVDQVKGLSAMRLAGCTPIEVQEHDLTTSASLGTPTVTEECDVLHLAHI